MRKNCLIGIVLLLTLLGLSSCPSPGGGGTETYNIGDTGPAGGLIFYDQGSTINGWRYMEAAPYDQNTGSEIWGPNPPGGSTGALGTAVGTGKANTAAIVSTFGTGYAASLCQNLSLNGYSDWFLPSTGELALVYQNLVANGLGNFRESVTDIGHRLK